MNEKHEFTNELINESSPYLLEHAHNPVNWHPWGDKALKKAKDENKPLIISIGYAACHWCHVMEKESFSDTSVARIMNENFVCIKVDREERPDVDQIYMDACQLVTGRGGWPLNAFALPDGRPFYAGTYFPKKQWVQLLEQLNSAYKTQNEKVVEQAVNITQGIRQMDLANLPKQETSDLKPGEYAGIYKQWEGNIDQKLGGFGSAPKFPLPTAWQFLLQYQYHTGNEEALNAVYLSLNEMAKGGIYDQIGGGFARYSTDAQWKVPHFEKMLYDNGQLISLYSQAYKISKNPVYKQIIEESLEFVKRELTHPKGGFFSSLNADSEGEEGKFYVWTHSELEQILSEKELDLCQEYYQVSKTGNWEHGNNILFRKEEALAFCERKKINIRDFSKTISKVKEKLMEERDKRIRPSTDDKILTSWNALMISGYVDASVALENGEYLETAISQAGFIKKNMIKADGSLWHNYKDGKASIQGFLEDYALLAQAFIKLYQATFNNEWLELGKKLVDHSLKNFSDEETGLFFFTSSSGQQLIARKMEIPDNVIPSSNSVMANNLFLLGHFYFDEGYLERSKKMLLSQLSSIPKGGAYYSNWGRLWGNFVNPYFEVAILGSESTKFQKEMRVNFIPNALYLGGEKEDLPLAKSKLVKGKTMIYVCLDRVCNLPVDKPKKALNQIKPQAKK
jgi:uncharacterized protein